MTEVCGTYTSPVYDGEPQSDPATRGYFVPPKPKETIERTYPLIDFLNDVFGKNNDAAAAEFLTKHGFTAVKHASSLTQRSDFEDTENLKNFDFQELSTLPQKVTGCKKVFMVISALRGDRNRQPDSYESELYKNGEKLPSGLSKDEDEKVSKAGTFNKSVAAAPIRNPYNDYTALGARTTIRFLTAELKYYATKAGVIGREDDICKYNYHSTGTLGPRYAAFSFWKPIYPVTRDPLIMILYEDVAKAEEELVIWPYDNRVPVFDGDWTREYHILKVKDPGMTNRKKKDGELKWHYVSNMMPDEVLIAKIFDSAALGDGVKKSIGSIHGSPEGVGSGEVRESVEIRVIAFC